MEEICSICPDNNTLAVGAADGTLLVWSLRELRKTFQENTGIPTRAVEWHPERRGILVYGAWSKNSNSVVSHNTLTNTIVSSFETNSHICSLAYGSAGELITTHGYPSNEVAVYSKDGRTQHLLKGHNKRVLHLAMSADHSTIITGSGDESIRYWSILQPPSSKAVPASLQSVLR